MLPSLVPSPQAPAGLDQALDAAYRYLAHRKQPEDKRFLEGLLQYPLVPSGPNPIAIMSVGSGIYSPERALGDELLAQWQNKPASWSASAEERAAFAYVANTRLKYLGGAAGVVWLPFEASQKFGPLSVFLIPAQLSKSG